MEILREREKSIISYGTIAINVLKLKNEKQKLYLWLRKKKCK
jgi:hypothetical protein